MATGEINGSAGLHAHLGWNEGVRNFLYKCRILHPFFIDWVAHHPAPRFHRRLAAPRTRGVYLETSLVFYKIKGIYLGKPIAGGFVRGTELSVTCQNNENFRFIAHSVNHQISSV